MTGIQTLTREPEQITAGDTTKWKRSFSEFPAPTWVLTYELRSKENTGQKITITAVQDGVTSDHLATISATGSATWKPGFYTWAAYMTAGSERKQVDRGHFEILPNLATAAANFDGRSHTKKVLDAINALLEGKALHDKESYTIANRSIKHMSIDELLKWRSRYQAEFRREQDALKIEKGLGTGNKLKTRFI